MFNAYVSWAFEAEFYFTHLHVDLVPHVKLRTAIYFADYSFICRVCFI